MAFGLGRETEIGRALSDALAAMTGAFKSRTALEVLSSAESHPSIRQGHLETKEVASPVRSPITTSSTQS